jgi:uncharacterized glyoxalase superfamily protein PhnB
MKCNALYPVLSVNNVKETADFYKEHFGFTETFVSDWYESLILEGDQSFQLAILASGHETIPEKFREQRASGVLINFEVEDVDELYQRCQAAGLPIHLTLRDEVWGQRHFITSDPSGVMIDVIKVIPPVGEAAEQYK